MQLETQKSTIANESIEEFGRGEQGVQILGNKRNATMDAFIDEGKGLKEQTLTALFKNIEPIIESICRFLYGHALPFVLVKSPLFASMVETIGNYGRGLKPLSYHETRVTYLKKEVNNLTLMLEKYKKEWKKTRCTLMSNGWLDKKNRSLINFLVNSPCGTVLSNQ